MTAHLKLLGTITIIMVTAGCATPQLRMAAPDFQPRTSVREQVVLKTSGESGQKFFGNLVLDGKPQSVSGVTPAEFHLRACVLTGELRKVSGDGTLSFKIERDNGGAFFGNLRKPGSSCRFGYHNGDVEVIGH